MADDITGVPFRVDKAEDVTESMVADTLGLTDKVTDFNIGSIYRTLLEAVAIQIEELSGKTFHGILRAIPAELYEAFSFPLRQPSFATGKVTFIRTSTGTSVVVPAGTMVTTTVTSGLASPKTFVTIEDVTLGVGVAEGTASVKATVPGTSGNVGAGLVNRFPSPIATITSVTNRNAILNGADEETESEREVRFRKYIANLPRCQLAGLEAGAMSVALTDGSNNVIEAVKFAQAVEHPNILGRIDLYIDNGGGSSSSTLITEVQKIIDGYKDGSGNRVHGYKAAGIQVVVKAIDGQSVPVTVYVEAEQGFVFTTLKPLIETAISDYIVNLGPLKGLIWADLVAAIANIRGVGEVKIITPTTSIAAAEGKRLLPGLITVGDLGSVVIIDNGPILAT